MASRAAYELTFMSPGNEHGRAGKLNVNHKGNVVLQVKQQGDTHVPELL